jgi:sporulation-control protein spo0M
MRSYDFQMVTDLPGKTPVTFGLKLAEWSKKGFEIKAVVNKGDFTVVFMQRLRGGDVHD